MDEYPITATQQQTSTTPRNKRSHSELQQPNDNSQINPTNVVGLSIPASSADFPTSSKPGPNPPKTGACSHCRHLKMRCIRDSEDPKGSCQRCIRLKRACQTPSVRKPGRIKGSKVTKTAEGSRVDNNPNKKPDSNPQTLQPTTKTSTTKDVTQPTSPNVGIQKQQPQQQQVYQQQQHTHHVPQSNTTPNVPPSSSSLQRSQSESPSYIHNRGPPSYNHQHGYTYAQHPPVSSHSASPSPHPAYNHHPLNKAQHQHQNQSQNQNQHHHYQHPHYLHLKSPSSISNPLGLLAEASEAVYPVSASAAAESKSDCYKRQKQARGNNTSLNNVNHKFGDNHQTNPYSSSSSSSPSITSSDNYSSNNNYKYNNNNNFNRYVTNYVPPPEFPQHIQQLLHQNVDPRIKALNIEEDFLLEGLETIMSPKHDHPPYIGDLTFYRTCPSPTCRDTGAELDPIDLAVVTEMEAIQYFDFFFKNLHPVTPVLDPTVHSLEFVRSRSAFLLTVICLNGAQFNEEGSASTTRLRLHVERLISIIDQKKYKSLEIVQATLLWLPWLQASAHIETDKSWRQTTFALEMALELGMNTPLRLPNISKNAHAEADLEGLDLQNSDLMVRMKRNRERTWLRFYLWETALSVAFGRGSVLVEDELINNQDWHTHPLACEHDKDVCALVHLRRCFRDIGASIRYRFQNNPVHGSAWIKEFIDENLEEWRDKWIGNMNIDVAPINVLYMDFMYKFGRIWMLAGALSRPNDDPSKPSAVSIDCFESALDACKFAVSNIRKSRYFWYLPNTIGPLLSYAAVLCIRLFDVSPEADPTASQMSLLGLLANLALLLERIGTTPQHRLGTAMTYGQHLKLIVRRKVMSLCQQMFVTKDDHQNLDGPSRRHSLESSYYPWKQNQEYMNDKIEFEGENAFYKPLYNAKPTNDTSEPHTPPCQQFSWGNKELPRMHKDSTIRVGSGWGDEIRNNMFEFLCPEDVLPNAVTS